ncbi:hypothetical protein F5Y13DRAFT_192981 [Hypoxylon sp. FL1857]|nr:hypothetical protein F5Y13DRAFT_192981 [Hypoxylon sp. FL1857]
MKPVSDGVTWAILIVGTYESLIAIQSYFWTKAFLRGKWFQEIPLLKRRIYQSICAPFVWLSSCIAISILFPFCLLYQIALGVPLLVIWCAHEVNPNGDLEMGRPVDNDTRQPGSNQHHDGIENNTFWDQGTAIRSDTSTQSSRGDTIGNIDSPEPPPPAYIP